MAIKSRNKVEASFNMSSMTDIVFLLLVFFIVASTLITPNGVNIQLPNGDSVIKSQPTTVAVDVEGQYALNGTKIAFNELEAGIISDLSTKKKKGIVLKADKAAPFELVVKIMNIASRHNFELVVATNGDK
jgi:biopolymer transport protein ExbD